MTAHRFRHTVGMQLAERGARLNTSMMVLGLAPASGGSLRVRPLSELRQVRDNQGVRTASAKPTPTRTGADRGCSEPWLGAGDGARPLHGAAHRAALG